MGKNQRKVSNERFLAAIPGTGGLHTVIAGKLGINRHTVTEYIRRDPVLADAVRDEVENTLDKVESVFINACLKQDIQACMFYLKTKGKHRGYTERMEQEITGKDGAPLTAPTITIQPVRAQNSQESADESKEP